MESELWRPVLLSGLGLVVALLCAFRAWFAYRGARLIAAAQPGAIGRLRPGLTEVKGVLHGQDQLIAPLSQRPCLYYRVLVEQRRRNRWEALVDRKESVGVWLDDGSGRVGLDPRSAEVLISSPKRHASGLFEVPSDELDGLLSRLGMELPADINPFVRYREELLEDGDTLTAVGSAAQVDSGWQLVADKQENLHSISDWDDAELIQRQRRTGLRWLLLALAAGVVVAVGAWQVLTSEVSPLR